MEFKQTRWIILLFTGLFFTHSGAQLPSSMPKNEYGLQVITTKEQYLTIVQSDENQRMVNLSGYVQPFKADWPYATTHNFTGKQLYKHPKAFVRIKVAVALSYVNESLNQYNLCLKFFDAYRPYSVTKLMWQQVPDEHYAANPAKGSGHNRGIAVDVTLADLITGKELPMPTIFDDFTEKAHHNYQNIDSQLINNRQLLKKTMMKFGFVPLETEWWHYSFADTVQYDIMDIGFNELEAYNKLIINKSYNDTIKKFQRNYITDLYPIIHHDTSYITFFPINIKWRVKAQAELLENEPAFNLTTSSGRTKKAKRYALFTFSFNKNTYRLYGYQLLNGNAAMSNSFFIPFTDITSGKESYGAGRYMDFNNTDIINHSLTIDFNKAYNPYCAFTSGYNCPIPPKENKIALAVKAGESYQSDKFSH